jgi:CDP-glucose 4,6-dehydratase
MTRRGEAAFDWQGHQVLVTGATGFLGAWLVSVLRGEGAGIIALVRDQVPQGHLWPSARLEGLVCVSGCVEDITVLDRVINEYEIDTVLHLAAQAIVPLANRSPLPTLEANVRGTYNVLEACRRNETVRAVVVASSDKAYGEQVLVPTPEDAPLLARHPYDVSKACADQLTLAYAATYGVPACVTRCGNLYGPGDRNWSRIVPSVIRSLLRGERPVVRSDGTPVRDYLYVGDAVYGYLALAAAIHEGNQHGEAFNLSDEDPVSVLGLVSEIVAACGSGLDPEVLGTATGEISRQYLSSAKARESLAWKPAVQRPDGLRRTVSWYRSWIETGVVLTPEGL